MPKSYDVCPKAVHDRLAAVMKKYHPELAKLKVQVDLLFISHDGDGPALKLHGYACAAVVRILSAKDRVAGRGDAEIVICRDGWEGMEDATRDALLDHELTHLQLKKDRNQKPKADDAGRPVLKMRLHDQQLGWFDEIARRHGEASIEIQSARHLLSRRGQLYFNFGGDAGPDTAETAESKVVHLPQSGGRSLPIDGFRKLVEQGDGVESVTIALGGKGVKIDKAGVHPIGAAAK